MCECLSTLSTGSGGKRKKTTEEHVRWGWVLGWVRSPRVSVFCFSAEWDRYRCGFLLKPLFVFVVLYVSYITLDWLCNLSDNKRHIHNADYEWLGFLFLYIQHRWLTSFSALCAFICICNPIVIFFFFVCVIVSDSSSVSIVAGVWASQRSHVLCMRAEGGAR